MTSFNAENEIKRDGHGRDSNYAQNDFLAAQIRTV